MINKLLIAQRTPLFITVTITLILLLCSKGAISQTYILNSASNNSVVSTCSGTFYDSGSSGGNYSNLENYTISFCAPSIGQKMVLNFTSFALEKNWDFLYIYDGNSTSSALIGKFNATSPGTITSTGSCLTIKFTSDASVNLAGWAANISCSPPPCAISLVNSVSSCFDSNGNSPGGTSMATVQTTVDWVGAPSGETINVSCTGASTQIINPATSAKPAVLNFTVPATGGSVNVSAAFSTTTTCSTSLTAITPAGNCLTQPSGTSSIGGTVFRDFNSNGILENSATYKETGVGGVTVTAYNSNNAIAATTTTANDGTYNLNTGSGQFRIEFTNFQNVDFSSFHGTNNQTSVQFANGGDFNVNLGINYPANYCGTLDPLVVTPCYINGDPLKSGANMATDNVLVSFQHSASIEFPPMTSLAVANQIGTTWGVAYQRESKYLFTSAFIKRHSGLGPSGISAIYKVDRNTNAVSTLVKLSDIGINVGVDPHNDLPNDKFAQSYDSLTFLAVGKLGIGAITLSDDGKYLFVTNLFQKKIHKIFIDNPARTPTAADVTTFNIPLTDCPNGDGFPFALKFYRGLLYVGITSTAETSQNINDLKSLVYSMDINLGTFTKVLTLQFNFQRGYPDIQYPNLKSWFPWSSSKNSNNYYKGGSYTVLPQPVLSAIEFDVDGSMVLDVMDRMGNQMGNNNLWPTKLESFATSSVAGGNIFRAQPNGSNWILENNATSNGIATAGVGNGKGVGGGEYYWDQEIYYHQDLTMGSLSLLPGSSTVFFSAVDATNGTLFSGGFRWLNNLTGAQDHNTLIYNGSNNNIGKANGLGGTVLLCSPPPIEIGNRVWKDLKNNGIQDAYETTVVGATVKLYDNSTNALLAITTTDAKGNYYFSSATTTIKPNTTYKITIENIGSDPSSVGLQLTNISTGGLGGINSGSTIANNDAVLVSDIPTIIYTTGNWGENNHSLDFGFRCTNGVTAGANQTLTCTGTNTATSVSLAATTSGGVWSQAASNISGAVITNPNAQNTTVTGLTVGYYKFIWTLPNYCPDTVTITVKACPTICDKAKLILSEYSNNFTQSDVLIYDFPIIGGMNSPHCDLGNGSGNDGFVIDSVKNIAYSIAGGNVKVYDYAAGNFTSTFSTAGNGNVYDATLSLDRNFLFIATSTGLLKMNVSNGNIVATKPIANFQGSGSLWGVTVNPTNGNVYTSRGFNNGTPATAGSSISFIDPNLSAIPTLVDLRIDGSVYTGIEFNKADNTLWAIVQRNYNNGGSTDVLVNFNYNGILIGSYNIPNSTTNPFGGTDNAPFDIAFGPDGNLYFTSFYGPCVSEFNLTTNTFSTIIPYVANNFGKGLAFACGNFKCFGCNLPIGGITVTNATCTNGIPLVNASIAFTGISSVTQVNIKQAGTFGTTPTYGDPTNKTVSNGSYTFSNLTQGLTYAIRLWSSSDACYRDTVATIPTTVCPCPTVAINNIGSGNICVGGSVTLNANVTNPRFDCQLQWQSKTIGGATWSNISGATSTSYTTAPNSSLNYRVTFNCANNGCCTTPIKPK